jgi:hypothetical protein
MTTRGQRAARAAGLEAQPETPTAGANGNPL